MSWQSYLDRRTAALIDEDGGALPAAPGASEAAVATAYRRVAAIAFREHPAVWSAALLLPAERRRAWHALAAFLWQGDRLGESNDEGARERFAIWRQRVLQPPLSDPIALAFADARWRFGIPEAWVRHQLDAQAMDHVIPEHRTMEDLVGYCFDILAPTALMALHILGVTAREPKPYAIRFAVAVQLTDMVGDVAEDLAEGRMFMPTGELHGGAWEGLVAKMVQRNRQLYRGADPGIAMLPFAGGLATRVLGALYEAQLDDIQAQGFDVFAHPGKFRMRHAGAAAAAAWKHLRGGPLEPPKWNAQRVDTKISRSPSMPTGRAKRM